MVLHKDRVEPHSSACNDTGTHEDVVCLGKESRIVDQRLLFLSSYQKEEMSVADLCRGYGISIIFANCSTITVRTKG